MMMMTMMMMMMMMMIVSPVFFLFVLFRHRECIFGMFVFIATSFSVIFPLFLRNNQCILQLYNWSEWRYLIKPYDIYNNY